MFGICQALRDLIGSKHQPDVSPKQPI